MLDQVLNAGTLSPVAVQKSVPKFPEAITFSVDSSGSSADTNAERKSEQIRLPSPNAGSVFFAVSGR